MSTPGTPVGDVAQESSVGAAAPLTAAGLQTSAMRASWWTAVQALVGLPLSVVVNLVVARTLGAQDYGLLASYMTAYLLLLAVLNVGINDATIQWGASAYSRGDRAQLIEICRRCAGFHIFLEAPIAAVTAAVLLRHESISTQIAAGLAVGIAVALSAAAVVLTAISMNAPLAKLSLLVTMSVQLAVVTAAVQTGDVGATWVARLALSLLAPLGSLVVAPRDIRQASLLPVFPRRWPEGFARYSARALVAGLALMLVFSRFELFVLQAYGHAAAAGLFALATGLAVQVTAPVDAMLGPLIPAAASLLEIGRERAATAVVRGIRLSVLATAPLAMVAIPAIAVLVPLLYGRGFALSGALFIALAVVSCLQSALHPVTAFLAALRQPMLVVRINVVALAIDLVLVLTLVPLVGVAGAVIGSCAGQITSLAASGWVLQHRLRLSLQDTTAAVLPFVCVAGCVVLGSAFGLVLSHHGVALWLCAVAAVLASSLAGTAALSSFGGIVSEADLAAAAAGFPRASAQVIRVLRGLHWVATG